MQAPTRLLALTAVAAALFTSAPAFSADTLVAALASSSQTASHAVADSYDIALRGALQHAEHYPDSREARQLRPTGTVAIWLDLDRDGEVVGAGIQEHSGSPILDAQALRSARTGRLPKPPAELLGDRGSQRFVVAVEFRDPSGR